MNILMFTNTFDPHVGGVAASVRAFVHEFRLRGHRVVVVAPTFPNLPPEEFDVIRVLAIQNFNGSDFSVRIPIPANLTARLQGFVPDVIHSHHPFLLGDTALRMSRLFNVPIVFTHHTMYERYTHYVRPDTPQLEQFVVQLSTGYANLCHAVIAPSESVRGILERRGVLSPIHVVPSGVDTELFTPGDRSSARRRLQIPERAFVAGHVGRLAREKNLHFLAECMLALLRKVDHANFLVVGDGPLLDTLREMFQSRGFGERLILTGALVGDALADAYRAMDVFVFSSHTETQGLVVAEAMTAGVPVIALDASGVREVVRDGINGVLLRGQHKGRFVDAAVQWSRLPDEETRRMGREAVRSAREFSRQRCSEKALAVYRSVLGTVPHEEVIEDSVWLSSLRFIEAEWGIMSNRAGSAQRILWTTKLWRSAPVQRVLRARRAALRWLNRTEWKVKVLRLRRSETSRGDPGLVMIQLDGLSRTEFERAIVNGRLPFLRSLLKREGYGVTSFYSGIPSTTPAVQAELFYGIKSAVPAFAFYRKENRFLSVMFSCQEIELLERGILRRVGEPLLQHGSCYSDIYSGGAHEVHYSPSRSTWRELLHTLNPLRVAMMLVLHPGTTARTVRDLVLEIFVGVMDALSGSFGGQEATKEFSFLTSRLGVGILLRNLITAGAIIDVTRGLQVVHINFLGYDEHAHRRGPHSQFAHWTLKGIDDCIRRLAGAARRSRRRDYDLWIYSDHGQEAAIPYVRIHGTTVYQALEEIFEDSKRGGHPQHSWRTPLRYLLQRLAGRMMIGRLIPSDGLRIAAAGPLGHVYAPSPTSDDEKERLARSMVAKGIPMVLFKTSEHNEVHAATEDGTFPFVTHAEALLGAHPFLDEVVSDLCTLCEHPDAGDFLISGWRRGSPPITFHLENGAHGGPGREETHGFALLPNRLIQHHVSEKPYWRGLDLRSEATHYLKRGSHRLAGASEETFTHAPAPLRGFRLVTYNVHSCIGTDGMLSPSRIARLLAEYNPDLIALQELDVGRARSEHEDQAHSIAEKLAMHLHFHPALHVEEERYGDAILSRHPMRVVRSEGLPTLRTRPELEPRGALWVEVQVGIETIQIITTHLGLAREERGLQAEALVSWVREASERGPVVLCGDLNTLPGSRVDRAFRSLLRDSAIAVGGPSAARTFPSAYPCLRLDYVYASETLRVRNVLVPRTALSKSASDHLPVVVDFELPTSHDVQHLSTASDDLRAASV